MLYIIICVYYSYKYANTHIMHVADLNWQQSPPNSSKFRSELKNWFCSVHFSFFCPAFNFSFNFAVGPVPLNLWLWPFGACWRLCMDHLPWRSGAQSVKRTLAQKQTRNSIFSGILKLISPMSCTAWFESFLRDTSDTLSKFRRWFCSGTRLKVIYLCFGDATWLSRLSLRSVLSFVIICETLTATCKLR